MKNLALFYIGHAAGLAIGLVGGTLFLDKYFPFQSKQTQPIKGNLSSSL
jgi:hypothetical protein